MRRLMRQCGSSCFSVGIVADILKIPRPKAMRLVRQLVTEGFFVDVSSSKHEKFVRTFIHGESDRIKFYELTSKGHALKSASARKPILRATAERTVKTFLERVNAVNADPKLMFWIDEVILFGSFVQGAEKLSDVDLAVSLSRKTDDLAEWRSLAKRRVREAEAEGKQVMSFFDRLAWPHWEIESRLRKGLPALQLHDITLDGTFVRSLPHERIYTRPTDTTTLTCPRCQHAVDVAL